MGEKCQEKKEKKEKNLKKVEIFFLILIFGRKITQTVQAL